MEIVVSIMAVVVAAGCLATLFYSGARELQRSRNGNEQDK